jgi:ubiquinone/menaquinone biosynthesis C-methylase UbiE
LDPIPSPNIWNHPAVYEVENLAVDRAGVIETAMRTRGDSAGRALLDIGCGTGFHLPRFAATAATVTGVEPHSSLAATARRRCRRLANVTVLDGAAEALPLPDTSVDVAHARWAYFFGPGCEPGLRELDRVMRRGGTAFVVDNDSTRSTFGSWFRRGYPDVEHPAGFWARNGWSRDQLDITWEFDSRGDFEAVVRIEFDQATAKWILANHRGTVVDYAVDLWWKQY